MKIKVVNKFNSSTELDAQLKEGRLKFKDYLGNLKQCELLAKFDKTLTNIIGGVYDLSTQTLRMYYK